MPRDPRLMLFDLYHGGHHGQHVRVLLEHWVREGLPGRLDVVVSEALCADHPELAEIAAGASGAALHAVAAPDVHGKSGRGAVLQNDLRIGRRLRRAVEAHRPDHAVLLYFDHVQLSLATGLRFPSPVRFSGTYFRPSFYYRERDGERGRPLAGDQLRTALDDLQKRTLLRLALRNPHVDTLFCLDPYAIGPVRQLGTPARVVHLPEPFEADAPATEAPDETRRRLGVEPGRRVLLLFGGLGPRKGALELFEALRLLPDHLARRACLVMAGEAKAIRREVEAAVAGLRQRGALQVVHLDRFVPDEEMHRLFASAALVLLPYQGHVGSSGVVVRAAAAGAPVLGPAYGMLGALIADRGLGLAVETARPAAIARGLARFLGEGEPFPFRPASARAWAEGNTERAMAETVFGHVLGGAGPSPAPAASGRGPAPPPR